MLRTMFKSKIHRATVTQADLHYVGSVTVDAELMDAADLLPGELVHIVDITNGSRLETYVIEGERGSGVIGINGAAAHLVHPGDLVILISYAQVDDAEARSLRPAVVHVDEENRIVGLGADAGEPVPGGSTTRSPARGARCGDGLGRAKSARAGEPRSRRGSGGSVHFEYQLAGGAAGARRLRVPWPPRPAGRSPSIVARSAPASTSSAMALMPAWSASTSIRSARTPSRSASSHELVPADRQDRDDDAARAQHAQGAGAVVAADRVEDHVDVLDGLGEVRRRGSRSPRRRPARAGSRAWPRWPCR